MMTAQHPLAPTRPSPVSISLGCSAISSCFMMLTSPSASSSLRRPTCSVAPRIIDISVVSLTHAESVHVSLCPGTASAPHIFGLVHHNPPLNTLLDCSPHLVTLSELIHCCLLCTQQLLVGVDQLQVTCGRHIRVLTNFPVTDNTHTRVCAGLHTQHRTRNAQDQLAVAVCVRPLPRSPGRLL